MSRAWTARACNRPGRTLALVLLLAAARIAHASLDVPASATGVQAGAAVPQDGRTLLATLGCGACHAGVPQPAVSVVALAPADRARDPAATFAYLLDPPVPPGPGAARMPSFHLDEAEALALALYLAGGRSARGNARDRFDAARRAYRVIDAAAGERVFRALNCGACHAPGPRAPQDAAAPPLAGVGQRLRPGALRDYIRRPAAVRPFGFVPGTGARMPDFRLSAAEADSIAAVLLGSAQPSAEAPRRLTPFAQQKARDLLDIRLSCLGCHALEGKGGRIGPDLSLASARLQPSYLRAVIEDPEHATPGTIMPRAALPDGTRELIVDFVAALDAATSHDAPRSGYLSLTEHTPMVTIDAPQASDTAALYRQRCAACHGADGRGDGYNARYLRVRPATHADAQAMGHRPDDTLYDGIFGGAAILGGSHEMPAYGQSLEPRQIRALVRYIRELCACTQPSWAGD